MLMRPTQGPAPRRAPSRCVRTALAALSLLAAGTIAAVLTPSCGKKGPPLAPVVSLPGPVEEFTARRLGGDVYIRLRVPTANLDKSTPADVSRVEVYGYTGSPGPNDNLVRRGMLVASLPVAPPAPETEEAPAKAPAPESLEQGGTATLVERLTGPVLTAVPLPEDNEKKTDADTDPRAHMLLWSDPGDIPARIYTAAALTRRGRRGPFAPRVTVPLVDPSSPPPEVKVSFTEHAVTISWSAPMDARTPVQATTTGSFLASRPLVRSFQATRYNVYVLSRESGASSPATEHAVQPQPRPEVPQPLNEKPVEGTTYQDPALDFGKERCYVVRSVDSYGAALLEGEPSRPVCVTPRDIFPPSAPRSLAAVSSGGAVSLIWEPNNEPDLAGYHVLRGNPGDETLQPITAVLVTGTTYRDTNVQAGSRYVYAVVAVDRATPPNVSAPSNRVEETVR
ncbi:MAG: fibronectin type III domain-containing protein [Vicinamibacterales bacterium]